MHRALWVATASVVAIGAFGLLVLIPLATQLNWAPVIASQEQIMNRTNRGVVLVDRNDRPFYRLYQARPTMVMPLADLPASVKQAVLAMEDRQFYSHHGFSLRGIARSIVWNLHRRDFSFGGSTITQQLVKNTLLTPRKNIVRKYQELILAVELERRYSKDDIFELYLNSAYFGRGAFGIEAAAQTFFAKPARQLTVPEAAYVVALLPSPSRLAADEDAALARQKLVLTTMHKQRIISDSDLAVAIKTTVTPHRPSEEPALLAAHFALMVKEALIRQYGEDELARSGWQVKTTLDLDAQAQAEKIVTEQIARLAAQRATNAAAVAMLPATGEVIALVGSRDWFYPGFGQVNMALAPRQPGSAFKPLVYATAFEKRIMTPASLLMDKPIVLANNYRPHNYDTRYRGPVVLRRALANSLNIPAVQTIQQTGVLPVVDMASRLGIHTLTDTQNYNLALALGAGEVRLLELTGAYSTLANHGTYVAPTLILEIQDRDKKPLYRFAAQPQTVLEPEIAFQLSSILSDRQARAEVFGSMLNTSRPTAIKTGTTENYRDAWTLGYTPYLAVGVWMGNNDNTPMYRVAGALGAAPIWRSLIEELSTVFPPSGFEPPPGMHRAYVCPYSGLLATGHGAGSYPEYFLPGTAPTRPCLKPPVEPSPSPAPAETTSLPVKENKPKKRPKLEAAQAPEQLPEAAQDV